MSTNDPLFGVIPAMLTPTTDDGADIDVARAKALTRRLIAAGVHGLFPAASTGEAPLLDRDQRLRLIQAVAEENNGRLPLLMGVGAMSTLQAVQYAKDAERSGATHIVVLPLHFFRVSEDELEAYFGTIADSVAIPTVLYNYPAITSDQNIAPSLAAKLSHEHNIVGIKDSSGDMTQALHYINRCTTDFTVFTGSESLLLSVLQHGGAGVVCAAANVIPEILVRIYDYFCQGESDSALDLQRAVLQTSAYWRMGTFPAAIKAAAGIVGDPVGPPFAPVWPLDETDVETIRKMLVSIPMVAPHISAQA